MLGLHRNKYKKLWLHLGRVRIRADRWPWMTRTTAALLAGPGERAGEKYGWKPTRGMGRFGGGWQWELGIDAGFYSVMIKLIFGTIMISWYREKTE